MHTTEKSVNFIFQAEREGLQIHLHTNYYDNHIPRSYSVHKAYGYQDTVNKISVKYNCAIPRDAHEIVSMTRKIDGLYVVGEVRDPFIFHAYEGTIYYYENGKWSSRINGVWNDMNDVPPKPAEQFCEQCADGYHPFGVYEGEMITTYERKQIAALIRT